MSDSERGVQGFAPYGRRLRRPWTPCSLSDKNASMRQADACRRLPGHHRRWGAWHRVIPYQLVAASSILTSCRCLVASSW